MSPYNWPSLGRVLGNNTLILCYKRPKDYFKGRSNTLTLESCRATNYHLQVNNILNPFTSATNLEVILKGIEQRLSKHLDSIKDDHLKLLLLFDNLIFYTNVSKMHWYLIQKIVKTTIQENV